MDGPGEMAPLFPRGQHCNSSTKNDSGLYANVLLEVKTLSVCKNTQCLERR